MRWSFVSSMTRAVVVGDGDDGDRCDYADGVLLLAQPKRAENPKTTTRGGQKRSKPAPVQRTRDKATVMATRQFRALESSNPRRNSSSLSRTGLTIQSTLVKPTCCPQPLPLSPYRCQPDFCCFGVVVTQLTHSLPLSTIIPTHNETIRIQPKSTN